MPNLSIHNLKAKIIETDKEVLRGVDLEIPAGEVHVVMGPNGSGKSSLAHVIAKNPQYQMTGGEILFGKEKISEMDPSEIAQKGIFLSFQNPVEIDGVSFPEFLRLAYNSKMKVANSESVDLKSMDFRKILLEKMKELNMDRSFLDRYLNQGFSGGEKKKAEVLQMLLLEPKLAIIDEIDSGLDVDALRTVASGINVLISKGSSILLITHYKRILEYIKADAVHILKEGKIVKSGGMELVDQLEEEGFNPTPALPLTMEGEQSAKKKLKMAK
ncbi:MAG: Fe-S cluster assembly ATP-binding protein [Parcubacteria group bacterium Gr01-1014_18]|nr:MAG: Fe-S cluster assembly ATP-binding protein [Parcubacteria group bacterium Greene0416_36]TSC80705.1 MAG: Fe-S cluster assembly ATP-binding protein [Parcubacteria group bacterium Gr01-1014_18]TSC98684.1 MAG: Fe-S cluster assembly ATP-binding protein [Parcubacteria group bacterium Greene1014_20]TSD07156.1 MAG: Fe-S cluster assembly ATP-binding protein [Parcubacteria group bacterium Greene0714_2]